MRFYQECVIAPIGQTSYVHWNGKGGEKREIVDNDFRRNVTAIVAKHNIIKSPSVGSFRFIPHFVNHHIILKLNILNLEDLAFPPRKKLLPISPSQRAAKQRTNGKELRKEGKSILDRAL